MKRITVEEADALTRDELAKDDACVYPVALYEATYSSIKNFEKDSKITWNGDGWYEVPVGVSSQRFVYVSETHDGVRAVTYKTDPRESLHRIALAPVRELSKNARKIAELRAGIEAARAEIRRLEGGA